jgi:carboxyl-terminal processing protease
MKRVNKRVFMSLIIGVALGFVITPLISRDNIYEELEKYRYIFNMAYRNYVDTVDIKGLNEAAITGMLKELDPHSVYIDEEEMKRVAEDFQGSFDGIGVQFDIINDTITVISPIADGPSEKLGILAGDKIVKIDGEDAIGIKRNDVPPKLKGPKGTHVVVAIKRSGVKDILTFDIERDKIPIYTVDASYILEGTKIGVIAVNRFAATTHEELMEGVAKLKQQGMEKLILDLRGNPGGYLNQASLMADEFIPAGDTLVYTNARDSRNNQYEVATSRGQLEDIPVIVLVNRGSASASEIVSGAIQDLDRGLVVGTTSFGKGLVQRQYPLPDGSAFRLTIARYYTPSGRCIQRPYEDADAYRRLEGRLELAEGKNIEHTLENIKKANAGSDTSKHIDLDSIEIYYTRAGRPVLGGGGITPDYVVKSDTITDLSVQMRRKRVTYEYINNKLQSGKEIKAKYGDDFERFYKEFEVTDKMLDELKELALEKEIEWDETDAEIDRDFWKIDIKANIARIVWGRNEYQVIFSAIDKQVQTAAGLFDEAEKIRKM